TPAPAKAAALAAPIAPTNKGTSDRPPAPRPQTKSRPDMEAPVHATAQAAPADGGAIQPQAVVSIGSPSTEPLPTAPADEKPAEAAAAAEPGEKSDDAKAAKVPQKTLPLGE